jgi:hypothetical protein
MRRASIVIVVCVATLGLQLARTEAMQGLSELFAPDHVSKAWMRTHCDLEPAGAGALRVTFWKGYENTGLETSQLPSGDWSSWRSLRFDVENQAAEPLSVYVRISDRADHPAGHTYTGGTFDGFVIGSGHSTVEISLEDMQSPDRVAVDRKRILWLAIFV